MKYEGNFNYFLDGESKTVEDIRKLVTLGMNVSVDGLNVNYFSPKITKTENSMPTDKVGDLNYENSNAIWNNTKREQKAIKNSRTEDYLKQADEVQKQNGGRLNLDSLVYAFELQREPKYPTQKDRDEFKKKIANLNNTVGKKEIDGKLDYSEINFRLLDLMAKRFMDNKHKYSKGNTLKDINKDDILWAAFRHIRKMIQPIENDPETYEDHLTAVATNMSIILDQLDKNKSK